MRGILLHRGPTVGNSRFAATYLEYKHPKTLVSLFKPLFLHLP